METYRQYVDTRTKHNPCVANLAKFLSNPRPKGGNVAITSLDLYDGESSPEERSVLLNELPQLLDEFRQAHSPFETVDKKGREGSSHYLEILIVQDLTKDVVELLGSSLNIDPIFFASHIHTSFKGGDIQTPDLASLPSRIRTQNYINIHYHRTIAVKDVPQPPKKLIREGNLDRKVVILPWTERSYIGLAQHCVSILHVEGRQYDLGLILVDPPITNRYYTEAEGYLKEVTLPTKLFLGGYESFVSSPAFSTEESTLIHPDRTNLMNDLVYYWLRTPNRPSFGPKSNPLSSLSYFPLKIVAGEWVNYVSVMHKSVKTYEYASNKTAGFLSELNKLNDDLRALQSWRRRSMSSQQKIHATISCMRWWKDADLDSLIEDYEYLARSIDESGRRLENMLPVVTSLVQVVDSRRSFAETANVTRLTILALVFVPLTYVSSLFSMNPEYGPGGARFWIYFAAALPVTLCVFLIARPPFTEIRWLLGYLNLCKRRIRMRKSAVKLESLPVSRESKSPI